MLDAKQVLEDVPPSLQGKLTRQLYELRAAGKPIVRAIDGASSVTVDDDESFHELIVLVERIECIAEVRDRLRELDEGKPGLSWKQVKEHLRQIHGLSL